MGQPLRCSSSQLCAVSRACCQTEFLENRPQCVAKKWGWLVKKKICRMPGGSFELPDAQSAAPSCRKPKTSSSSPSSSKNDRKKKKEAEKVWKSEEGEEAASPAVPRKTKRRRNVSRPALRTPRGQQERQTKTRKRKQAVQRSPRGQGRRTPMEAATQEASSRDGREATPWEGKARTCRRRRPEKQLTRLGMRVTWRCSCQTLPNSAANMAGGDGCTIQVGEGARVCRSHPWGVASRTWSWKFQSFVKWLDWRSWSQSTVAEDAGPARKDWGLPGLRHKDHRRRVCWQVRTKRYRRERMAFMSCFAMGSQSDSYCCSNWIWSKSFASGF